MKLFEKRDFVGNTFIMLFLVLVGFFYLKGENPFLFPGLEEKLVWLVLITGVLAFVLYLPYDKIIGKIKGNKIRVKKENMIKNLLNFVFQVSLVFFLFMLLIREFVSDFFGFVDINYLMLFVILFGVLSVFYPAKSRKNRKEKIGKSDYVLILFFAILGSIIVWYKTADIGYLSYVISILTGILIVVLSILVLEEE